MKKNVCGLDRAVRALLWALLVLYSIGTSGRRDGDDRSVTAPRLLLAYATAELSVNVFAQWCPLNALFGINTCRDE